MNTKTTSEAQKEKINALIDQFAKDPDIIEYVRTVEGDKLKTTKGNYGRYMGLISTYHKQGHVYAYIITQALIKAGAGTGAADAYKIVTGAY